jgi:hypothetical protein
VKGTDYGDDWPLTIPEAKLICEQPSAVYLEADSKHYGVNGFGKNYVSKEYPTTARELERIWRPHPDGITPRVNIGPLIDRGLAICDG